MKRSIQKWQDSDPDYMVKKLSRLGLLSALRDAKADILELHAEVERLRGALLTIAGKPSGSDKDADFYHNEYHECVHAARIILRDIGPRPGGCR